MDVLKLLNVEFIANLCHEVNRGYCESIGDYTQKPWEESPEWQKQSAVNGVKFHLENDATPKDTHINWMNDKIKDGWVYGEVKDPEKKTHPCMIPYEELPQEQRSKDYLFKAIVDFYKSN